MSDCIEWAGRRNRQGYGYLWWKGKSRRIHRVVYDLFHGEMPRVVRHKCDNPSCYNIDHLEGGTYTDNARDMYERGRDNHAKGERNGNSKLDIEKVSEIRKLLSSGETQRKVAARFGVDQQTVWSIKAGKTWKGVK